VSRPLGPEDLERITNLLNERLQGKSIHRSEDLLGELSPENIDSEILSGIKEVHNTVMGEASKGVFLGGRTRLLDFVDFKDISRIKVLMELLDDEKVVAEILSETLKEERIQVLIGEENPVDVMKECSMVVARYKIDGIPVGTLGILGPKRMPYEKVIQIVNYTAENFSSKLKRLDQL
jgi:heat-inducible transcriptional repressor